MIKIVLLNKHFLLRLNTNSERIATKQKRTKCHKHFFLDKKSFGFKRMQDIGTTDARHRLFVGPSFFTVLQRGAFFKALEIPPIFADKGDEAISSTSFSSSFPTLTICARNVSRDTKVLPLRGGVGLATNVSGFIELRGGVIMTATDTLDISEEPGQQ